jgi:hypothetical protein
MFLSFIAKVLRQLFVTFSALDAFKLVPDAAETLTDEMFWYKQLKVALDEHEKLALPKGHIIKVNCSNIATMKGVLVHFRAFPLKGIVNFDTIRLFLPVQASLWLAYFLQERLVSGSRMSSLDPEVLVRATDVKDPSSKAVGKIWRGQLLVRGDPFPDAFPTRLSWEQRAAVDRFVSRAKTTCRAEWASVPEQSVVTTQNEFSLRVVIQQVNQARQDDAYKEGNIVTREEMSGTKCFARWIVDPKTSTALLNYKNNSLLHGCLLPELQRLAQVAFSPNTPPDLSTKKRKALPVWQPAHSHSSSSHARG